MATKVKPTRLQITGTPQSWDVPMYVNADCFCRWQWWAVVWPSASCDWDVAIFCGTCWDCIIDSWEKLCDYAKQCDLTNLAQCCDIPTDNCQLSNGCGYTTCTGTVSTCADIISKLWYTPYNSTNPNWYTTCIWTVTNADLACYAKCCDMPDMSCYQQVCNLVCDLTWADNTHYPSAKAVADAIQCAWGWDMMKSVYDPHNCNADAFDYCNFSNTPTIPTDNCQLGNGCWYTTCTWTVSTCADIISKLWYTPYNSTNPNWYTTCTGTVVAWDLAPYAKSCDLCAIATSWLYCDISWRVTDNCQIGNGCGYTTCTWTLVPSDLNGYALSCDVLTKTNTTAYNPTADYNPATKKYVDDNGGKTYIAGDGISIPNTADYSAMQWPCPNWYHVPSREENSAIVDAMTALGIDTSTWACMKTYLKMPYAWYRNQLTGSAAAQGTAWRYWSYLRLNVNTASVLAFQSNGNGNSNASAAYGMSIRPFKDEAVIPDNTWTTLFDGSLIATNAWIFHNTTDGIISISADGTTWITIADKNLWATVVYNDGDTLSENNAGWYFQHWNNYMFPFTWSVTTSSTKVDTTGYWPWNYYSSSTFIAVSWDWSSVYNSNLWWGDTWVVIANNVIYNTGVLEVNWCTWCVCLNIPTDNCQLCNGCWYTTCTWTLQSCDIACINGCCLTNWGDICIQSWWIQNLAGSPVCICYKWTWDMCAYCALGTYRCDTEYNVYQ